MHRTAVLVAGCLLALSCGTNAADDAVTGDTPAITTTVRIDTSTTTSTGSVHRTEQLMVEVIDTIGHEPTSFTQGLVKIPGGFYESIGLYGQSALLETDDEGAVVRRMPLDDALFAEGLELVDGRLIQLTYRAETALVYDAETFEVIDQLPYQGEGWGLCRLDDDVVMSNGSAELTLRDPDTFAIRSSVPVRLDGRPVDQLNELECVDETVWANVWKQEIIVGIDPVTGRVHSVVDASGLFDPGPSSESVLNGIAHDDETGTFWLTGKNWPAAFEVRFVAAE
ncbi:MAG: glutaminyl-peptide cyclotransferase [Acidimicrobiia bacterium]|nr:glutaminyl-peptide cyclotransferase [Acidimicrobiia bacterium]MDH5236685.1 glutaminyl-peptide cyclotransferase [Acidimicrobiia bacterium]